MQTINLNILSGAIPPVAHCSQGDVGRQIDFAITDDGADYAIPTGAVVWVEGTKYDKHGFAYDSTNQPTVVSYTGNVVTVLTTEQMTACAGKATCELKIVSGSTILYTLNFSLDVEPMALPSDSDMSKTDIPLIKQAIDAGDTAEISAKEAAASAKEAAASAKEAESAVTGVVSFNGRQGAVSPASGDYTPDMVGLNSIAPYKVATTPTASGTNAIAVGSNTKATGARSVGIGQSVTASGAEAVAIGTGASAANSDTVAVGHLATAKTSINGVAIGANAQATGKGSVAIGYGSKATEADTVSVGARRIVNVSTPTGDNDAANKAYVDSADSALGTRLTTAENSISTLDTALTSVDNSVLSTLFANAFLFRGNCSDTSLQDVRTLGCYNFAYADPSAYDAPVDIGILLVIGNNNEGWWGQICLEKSDATCIYFRTIWGSNNKFGPWYKIDGTVVTTQS